MGRELLRRQGVVENISRADADHVTVQVNEEERNDQGHVTMRQNIGTWRVARADQPQVGDIVEMTLKVIDADTVVPESKR